MIPVHLFVASFLGWLQCHQHKVVEYLCEENRVLEARLRSRRARPRRMTPRGKEPNP